jgi:cobalt-zinc-cadmium efflux system membrane fusion protein
MSSLKIVALLIVLGTAVACGRAKAPASSALEEKPHAAEPEDAHDDVSEVRIEAGMMRDLRVRSAKVESRQGDEQVTLLGELAVDERSYAVVGVPVAARVVSLFAGVGDAVRGGQSLAELQAPEVGRARSDYFTAVAHSTLAESALKRKRDLAAERIAPQREVQEAEAAAEAARSEVRAATAALNAMGLDVPKEAAGDRGSPSFLMRSPVRGTVIERKAVVGQMLEPGVDAFRVADLSTLWLAVHAFERDAVRIQTATPARVTFSALPGQTFPGRVMLVGRQVSSESRTIDVRIEVRNRDGVLRPGMSASATVPIGVNKTPILAVPVAAVQRVGESWCVFIPKAADHFEVRKIGRGRDLGTEVEILSGVAAGETIVVDGAFLLKAQAERANAGHDDH